MQRLTTMLTGGRFSRQFHAAEVPPTSRRHRLAAALTLAMSGTSACIIPDHDIQVISDCGDKWCATIPMSGAGRAWGDQDGLLDVAVVTVSGPLITAVSGCVCMTPSESAVLDEGCADAPCDPEYTQLVAEVVNVTYEACLTAAVESFEPDLNQNTALVTMGNTCLEASPFWTVTKTMDACSVPTEECGTGGAPLVSGGGPEPYLAYSISCSGGTCTVPDALLDALDAAPELLINSATRLTQVKSGGVPIGLKFSGIVTNSLAYRLGFRNNDIAQQVNGLPFKVQSDLLAVFVELRTSENATVRVKRGSSTVYLNFVRQQPWP